MVPPVELEVSINNLRTELDQKLAEMEKIIKKLKKSKKKKKAEKKTIEQRMAVLSEKQKDNVGVALSYCEMERYSFKGLCCPFVKASDSLSFWPALFKVGKSKE